MIELDTTEPERGWDQREYEQARDFAVWKFHWDRNEKMERQRIVRLMLGSSKVN